MAVREERTRLVLELARVNGYQAGFDDAGLAEANRFFLHNLPIDRSPSATDGAALIDDQWMSVIWDLALLIGQTAIARHPDLSWEFFDPGRRKTLGAYAPCLVGHREGDVTLPFLHLQGYALQVCDPGLTRVVNVKGLDVPLFPAPVRIDKFVHLIEIEQRLA